MNLPQNIDSIDLLIKAFDTLQDKGRFLEILRHAEISAEQLRPYNKWNEKGYTRTCIDHNDEREFMVVCYEPGQKTSIHDFDSQQAWVLVVEGDLTEQRFDMDREKGLIKRHVVMLNTGSCSHMSNGSSIHRYINTSGGRTVTLNIYSRPLSKWKVYDERTGSIAERPVDHGT